jgi:rRNA maturation protein Nop10
MPSCRSCNPTCQRCHKKPGFRLPQECPVCGRYNPAHWETCKRCGAAVPAPAPHEEKTHLSAQTSKNCFRCDPLNAPLCKQCVKLGRIKVCPACSSYVLGTRKDCKRCGYAFEL